MDVEWAHVMAPAASILVVEDNEARFADLLDWHWHCRQGGGSVRGFDELGQPEFAGETSNDSVFATPAGHQR